MMAELGMCNTSYTLYYKQGEGSTSYVEFLTYTYAYTLQLFLVTLLWDMVYTL